MEDYYDLILWTGSVVTFLIQLYILYLIKFESFKEMKEYAFFLKILTGYEILFNLGFGIFLAPKHIFGIFGVEIHGLAKYFGLDFCMYCAAFTFYAGAMIVTSQIYCLMYRYVIFGTYKNLYQIFMSIHSKMGMQFMAQVPIIGFSVFFYNIFYTKEELPELIEAFRGKTEPPITLDNFPVIMKGLSDRKAVIFFELIAMLFCLAQTTSFALLYLIVKTMRKNAGSMTKDTFRLYWQFTALLGAQLLTPLVFLFVPSICAVLIVLHIIEPSLVYIELGYLGFMFYGLANSLLTMSFVTPFRRHAAKTFVYWWLKPLLKCLKLDKLIPVQRRSTITRVVPMTTNKY